MKKFLIIGNGNAVTYKEIFPLIKENKIWLGQNNKGGTRKGNTLVFTTPNVGAKTLGTICWWYTNLTHQKRNEEIFLYKKYNTESYPKYDNYDAIEVSKVAEIPMDYDGVMGVPITFLDKYCPTQFEIVGCHEPCIELDVYKKSTIWKGEIKSRQITRNGKICQKTYHRLFIKHIS